MSERHLVKKKRRRLRRREGDAEGKINSAGKYKNEDWRVGKRRDGEEERVCEQRKLRGFDAPFLSVNGTVIVKAAGAIASLVAGEVDVIVSIAGRHVTARRFSLLHSPFSQSVLLVLRTVCVPLADSRPRHTKNPLASQSPPESRIRKHASIVLL